MEWFTLSLHDDGLGEASLELLASAQAPHAPAVEAELQALLAHALQTAQALGADWAHDLQRTRDGEWLSVHLTLSGPSDWVDALAADWDA